MKKTGLGPRPLCAAALAVLAATAHAQSSVTLAGLMDLSIGSTKPPGGESSKGVDSGKMTTSWVGLRGREDLGGGLETVFALESFLRADTGASGRFNGDTFWARNAWVGLSSKSLGRLTIGRNTTPLFVSTLSYNPFGDSFGYSPSIRHTFTSGTVTGDTGWSDSIQYTSPSFGGFSGGLIGAAGEGSNGRNWGANLGYSGGALGLSFVFQDVEKDNGTPLDDTRTWQLAGAYDFGAAKLFAQYADVENRTTGNEFKLAALGATVPVGDGRILAAYGRLKPDEGAKRQTFSLGYDHFLSKRTDVYAVAMSDKLDGLSRGHGYSLGIRHRF